MHIREIHVGLIDSHILFRETLGIFLSQHENIKIVLEAHDTRQLLAGLKTTPVEVLIIDLFSLDPETNETLKVIRHEHPKIKIIALSVRSDLQFINTLLDIGIHGYISKSDRLEELLQAITAVREGRIYRNKQLTEALYVDRENTIKTTRRRKLVLTEREKKILQLLWEEKSNREIANELFLGIRSIEKIRQDIKEKFGVKSTIGLLKYAISNKIINVDNYVNNLSNNVIIQ